MSIVSQRVWKENGILSFIDFCFLRTYILKAKSNFTLLIYTCIPFHDIFE